MCIYYTSFFSFRVFFFTLFCVVTCSIVLYIRSLWLVHWGSRNTQYTHSYSQMASSSGVASGSTDRKRVIRELTRGRETAEKLRLLLFEPPLDLAASEWPVRARGLVAKILDSCTQSLSILCASDESSEVVPAAPMNSPPQKSQHSGESCKTPAPKDRRGCYKRRRTSETWTQDSPTWLEDGHAWRKYGQKVILNAKHPRNYFRCSHKHDQGCPATKQVQQIQDHPPLFRTTYHALHSCKNSSNHHTMITVAPAPDSSIIWSFHEPNATDSAAFKLENTDHQDLRARKSSPPLPAISPGSDRGDAISSDVYSCTTSTHSIEMDVIGVGSVFDDFFEI